MLTETPRLPGTDGRRMAKSYGNAIWLSDPPDEIRTKARNMMTDPQRQRRTDPGRPEVCPVFAWHKLFSPPETIAWADQGCRTAGIGCVDCKKAMAENLVKWIEPIQARRKEFEANPQQVWDTLDAGNKKAQARAPHDEARPQRHLQMGRGAKVNGRSLKSRLLPAGDKERSLVASLARDDSERQRRGMQVADHSKSLMHSLP